eukprot:COSAG04_NODE_15075_length_544_cov_1.723596_1_plen_113_part_01
MAEEAARAQARRAERLAALAPEPEPELELEQLPEPEPEPGSQQEPPSASSATGDKKVFQLNPEAKSFLFEFNPRASSFLPGQLQKKNEAALRNAAQDGRTAEVRVLLAAGTDP